MFDVQAMRLFVRVVELGSFSKGASDLGIGQPTATKLVAKLEKELSARLLHRSTHGLTTTEVGALYYDKFKHILLFLEEAQTQAARMQSEVQGSLRISTTMDFGRRVMAPLVFRFLEENPQVQIELLFDDHLVDLVEQGIDVAIRMGRLADSGLGARYLNRNPWTLVASPEYLRRHGKPNHPEELASHRALICSTVQSDSRWQFESVGHPSLSVPLSGSLRSNNKSALMEAACLGFGIAALPTYVVSEALSRGALCALLTDWTLPSQDVHAVFPSPRMLPTKVSGFVGWLREQLTEDWWNRRF